MAGSCCQVHRVSRPAHGDIRKLGISLSASFLTGALTAPWICNVGKALEEVTRGKRVNPVVDRLAEWCRVAGFEEFCHVSVVVALVVGAVPFLLWLGVAGRKSVGMGGSEGRPLVPDEQGWQRCLAGFGNASGLFWLIAWLLTTAGSFAWGGTHQGLLPLTILAVAALMFHFLTPDDA